MVEQTAGENGHADVRGLPAPVLKTHRTGFDGLEPVRAVGVRGGAAETAEGRLGITALAVRLPDFHHRVRHANAVAVGNAPFDPNALASRIRANEDIARRPLTAQAI